MSEVKFISPETIEQAVDAYSKSSKEGKTKILAGVLTFWFKFGLEYLNLIQ